MTTRRIGNFSIEIDGSTQYATIYHHTRPIGTMRRRRVYGEEGQPAWRAYDLDGVEIASHMNFSHPCFRAAVKYFGGEA